MPSMPRPKGKASQIAYELLGVGEKPKRKSVKRRAKQQDIVEGPFLPEN